MDVSTQDSKSGCVVFAGGGSGGHISPGIAIIERLAGVDPDVKYAFCCSGKPVDREMLTEAQVEFRPLPAVGLTWRPIPFGPIRFARGWLRSRRLAKDFLQVKTRRFGSERVCVVGLGGYVAAPVASAAASLGVHVILLNLDVVPGKANRQAARWADTVLSAVATQGQSPFEKAQVIGMPVRRRAVATRSKAECRARLGLEPDLRVLFITGASQGAGTLNELMIDLVSNAATRPVFDGWQVLHLSGPDSDREKSIQAAYLNAGVTARVIPFLHEIGIAWGAADLALGRAGASTVAESALNRVPMVFVPYPWHRDRHQKHNAEPIAKIGGGWLAEDRIELAHNRKSIGQILTSVMSTPGTIESAKAALDSMPLPDAALEVANLIRFRLRTDCEFRTG